MRIASPSAKSCIAVSFFKFASSSRNVLASIVNRSIANQPRTLPSKIGGTGGVSLKSGPRRRSVRSESVISTDIGPCKSVNILNPKPLFSKTLASLASTNARASSEYNSIFTTTSFPPALAKNALPNSPPAIYLMSR